MSIHSIPTPALDDAEFLFEAVDRIPRPCGGREAGGPVQVYLSTPQPMKKTKVQIREELLSAMRRPTNPNNTLEKFATVVSAVSGVSCAKIKDFLSGSDIALSERECDMINTLS